MFEHREQPVLSRSAFLLRQLKFILYAALFVGVSLAMGTWGYVHFAGQGAVDAFLNASMILSGMGPIGDLPNDGAKLFASFYALYSGVALLTVVATLLAPIVHRFLHTLHIAAEDDDDRRRRK
ncbi:MAG TPA: hypothetical protein PLB89_11720 [Flavobacteriales bacterium]|nr:hypothetical protein [Flavobacteriales bacterium]